MLFPAARLFPGFVVERRWRLERKVRKRFSTQDQFFNTPAQCHSIYQSWLWGVPKKLITSPSIREGREERAGRTDPKFESCCPSRQPVTIPVA